MQEKSLTQPLKFQEKLGYAMGDMAGLVTFSIVGAFQNKFYTDVLHLDPAKVAVLILVARLLDAFVDPLWGAFIDSRKPTKYGRFRPYILAFSVPLAVSAVLMFTVIPNLSQAKYLLYAYITYIAYGILYTTVNIPYGSLASVMTSDEKERSTLSMWRSVGAGVGGVPGSIILPLIVYNTSVSESGEKIQTLNSTVLTVSVLVLSILSVFIYYAHFKLTKEHITPTEKKEKYNVFKAIADLFKNGSFIALAVTGMLFIAFQFYYQAAYTYLFADYYRNAGMYSLVTVFTYIPMICLLFFTNTLIDKFGKKEICTAGLVFSAVTSFILYFVRPSNPYVFLFFVLLSGLGQTFFTLEVWALLMDIIDSHELRTHRREEGTAYALFSFFRKLGQTLAGVAFNALLAVIGYSAESGQALSSEVREKLFDVSTLVPAVMLAVMAVVLAFGYRLSKKKLYKMRAELSVIRNEEA